MEHTEQQGNTAQENTQDNAATMEKSIKELLLIGYKNTPGDRAVMEHHLTPKRGAATPETATTEADNAKAMDSAILTMRSPMSEEQRNVLIPLLLGAEAPNSEEQSAAIQGFINAVESYLNMEHDSWDEFLGTGSRPLMRRITTPIDKNLEELATEILGEPSSTNRFAFDMLAHLGMDDEMNRDREIIKTPRELISQELDLRTKEELKILLTIFTCAPLGAPVEDMPIFDFLTEEWAEKQRQGVGIGAHIEPFEEEAVTPEEIIADIHALAKEGEAPTKAKEGENERAGGDNTPEEGEEDPENKEDVITTMPSRSLELREAIEKIGDITLRGIAVNGRGYSIPTWNSIISQVPPERMKSLAEFSQEALGDSEVLAQLTLNAPHLTWGNIFEAVDLSGELSLPVAMAVMDWEGEKQ